MRMYFIALLLPDDLNEQIVAMKEFMRDRYMTRVALRSPAHLTLVPPFWMDEAQAGSLVQQMDDFAKALSSFVIEQDGFSSFPPKTIFISAKPNPTLETLHQKTKEFFGRRPEFPMKFDERPFHPHVTIATRDLTKKSYHEAWAYFKNKNFQKSWTCTSVSLLGLSETGWQVLHTSYMESNR